MRSVPYQDTIVGLLLLVVILGYAIMNRIDPPQQEAVLAEISGVMIDLEAAILKTAHTQGLSEHTSLSHIIASDDTTALFAKDSEPWLMPDTNESAQGKRVGGCPTSPETFVALRLDRVALTYIPTQWTRPVERICLDRNGSAGPNKEGSDVIWLAVSRFGIPHVTLIPSKAID